MSFLLVMLYITCTFLRPQDWVEVFYNKPLVDFLAGGTIFFLLLERLNSRRSFLVQVPQNKLILGLFLSILMSHVVHTYFGGLMLAWEHFLPIFILFFLLLNSINTKKKFGMIVWLMIFLIAILVPQGMYQLERGYGWAGQNITHDFHRQEYRINWIGIFNDPNDLALAFVIAIGFLLAFAFGRIMFLMRVASLGLIGLLSYGIFLTNSRGGLLALMVTIYFYFVKRTNKMVVGSIIGAILAFAVFAIGPSRKALFNVEEASAASRVELWYGGILLMKANPIFGAGYDMFTEDLPQTAHNSFILAGAELGMVGLFFWMALIYSSYQGLSTVQQKDPDLRTYAIGLQSALVGFMAAAFFLSRTYVIVPYLLFALSGALMDIARQRNKDIVYSFGKAEVKGTILWCTGIILTAYVIIKIGL